MPVFTFEKISPPVRHGSNPPVSNPSIAGEQRGVIVQLLDRFVATRVKRSLTVDALRVEKGVIARREAKLPE